MHKTKETKGNYDKSSVQHVLVYAIRKGLSLFTHSTSNDQPSHFGLLFFSLIKLLYELGKHFWEIYKEGHYEILFSSADLIVSK